MEKKMKTILILGGYGFLGTNVLKFIDSHFHKSYKCIVFDKYQRHPHGVDFECVSKTYAGDFTDRELLSQIFRENTIDIILHSLSTTIPVSTSSARYDVETNLLPTIDVLGLMVKHEVKKIIYISSGGAIYGTTNTNPHKEDDDVFPISSYGVVKLAAEKYMMQYAELYGIKPLIIRLSNPYGPYHYGVKQGVINVAMLKALQLQGLQIWGNGKGKKDYIYVEDFVDILFRLLERNVENTVVNVGSGQLLSVNEIVSFVSKLSHGMKWQYVDAQRNDASHFELNTGRLKNLIGQYSYTSIEDGFLKTFKWTEQSFNEK
ncbi:MAG: NAD-dependent epimerase/dehydratase family protein [Paludibacteraceae bacterium]|nr:NAD-dependent epimerase/dehydratase family protein [Paludibacteraceae bacterium]